MDICYTPHDQERHCKGNVSRSEERWNRRIAYNSANPSQITPLCLRTGTDSIPLQKQFRKAELEWILVLTRFHVLVPSLLPDEIEANGEWKGEDTESPCPPDDGVTYQIILDLIISPTTHTKA